MAFFGKEFVLDKNENFEDFVKSLGLPAEQTEKYIQSKPTHKIEREGDVFVFTTTTENGPKVLKFKDGVEFDEVVTPEITTKSIVTIEGSKATHVQKLGDKAITFVREFTPDQLIVTITSNFWNGTAKRYYVAK